MLPIAESQKKRLISQLHSAERFRRWVLRRSLTYTYTALGHALIATDPLPHRCVYPNGITTSQSMTARRCSDANGLPSFCASE